MKRKPTKSYATLSHVKPRKIEWLLRPQIPYGMITIVEGDPNVGKSYLAMELAAKVSTGGKLPNGDRVKQGRVLYINVEDDPALTMRPRIDVLGGDPRMIRYQARYSPLDDDGLETLREEVGKFPPALIVIDTLYDFVGDRDPHKSTEIRQFLGQLQEFATETGAAIILIRHLTKAKKDRALYQGSGAIDVIAFARSALLVARHPERSHQIVMAHLKHNLSEQGPSYIYELLKDDPDSLPALEWRGTTHLTAVDLSRAEEKRPISELSKAEGFLREILKKGPKPSTLVSKRAKDLDIADRTLDRAKENLGVIPEKRGGRGPWFCRLPTQQ